MRHVERLAALIFGFAFLGLALAVAVETFMRKVFNQSLQGVDELGGYVLAVGAGLSFAVALASRAHIRIDVLHDLLPRFLRVSLNVTAAVALAACALAAFYMAWLSLQDTILFSATAQTPWATPLKYPQSLWVAGLAMFAILAIADVVRVTGLLLRGEARVVDKTYGPRGTKEELAEELADLKARGVAAVDANTTDVRR
jgi:TRAP-type C4-dicarboxylate transport system permease small subunit